MPRGLHNVNKAKAPPIIPGTKAENHSPQKGTGQVRGYCNGCTYPAYAFKEKHHYTTHLNSKKSGRNVLPRYPVIELIISSTSSTVACGWVLNLTIGEYCWTALKTSSSHKIRYRAMVLLFWVLEMFERSLIDRGPCARPTERQFASPCLQECFHVL